MKILIDADGCPVVGLAVELANSFGVCCTILCDTSHTISYPGAQTKVYDKGADSVDFALVNQVEPGDIVVTQDYGLAAMCLSRRAIPISQNGLIYSDENIDSLLLSRHTAKRIRNARGRLKGPPKRTPEQDDAFAQAFKQLLWQQKNLHGNFPI